MKKIINEPSRADVTFILDSGKFFHAHRCILLARCSSFEERIRSQGRKSDEREKQKWGIAHANHMILELPNFKFRAFSALIEYLYTDQVKLLRDANSIPQVQNQTEEDLFETENLLDLLQISHELKIEKLRKLCEEAIEPSITIENSSIILRRSHEIGS